MPFVHNLNPVLVAINEIKASTERLFTCIDALAAADYECGSGVLHPIALEDVDYRTLLQENFEDAGFDSQIMASMPDDIQSIVHRTALRRKNSRYVCAENSLKLPLVFEHKCEGLCMHLHGTSRHIRGLKGAVQLALRMPAVITISHILKKSRSALLLEASGLTHSRLV